MWRVERMPAIDLQTGFNGQRIEIRIGDRLLFSKANVQTKKVFGLADSVEFEFGNGEQQARIRVIVDGLEECSIDSNSLDATPYVGISVESGGFKCVQSAKPFGYG